MSDGRKALLESEPNSILHALEAPANHGNRECCCDSSRPCFGRGGIGAYGKAKALYGPSCGIIQNIQYIQGF